MFITSPLSNRSGQAGRRTIVFDLTPLTN